MARHNIPVDPRQGRNGPLDVILDDAIEDQFDVSAASVPPGLPLTYQGRSITWLSNFRVQKKPGRAKTGKKVKYSIELDSVPGTLIYYDESSNAPLALTTRSVGGNRIQADLSVDDPPIGHT
jgi:hypothetical protein